MEKKLLKILKSNWNYNNFHPIQKKIILSVLSNKDVIAILPTGGGKSLCFQVPGLYRQGICLIISPLISLINDQLQNLKKHNIKALTINSTMNNNQIDICLNNCMYGNYKFLYISPERINSEIFLERIKKIQINLIAVDEAHCISQYGHDFRPSYLNIAKLREFLPNVNIVALTASAHKQTIGDIVKYLKLQNFDVHKDSLLRKNLTYSVKYTPNKDFYLQGIIKKVKGPTIIYTNIRKKTEKIVQILKHNGIKAMFYHGGMDSISRNKAQTKWINNEFDIIVATCAFGMGIDKKNVRYVIHYNPPSTLEEYYQETGRAGRDGLFSHTLLLYNEEDVNRIQKEINIKYPTLKILNQIYNSLMNYLSISYNDVNIIERNFKFDLENFAYYSKIDFKYVYNSLNIFQKYNIIQYSLNNSNYIKLIVAKDQLLLLRKQNNLWDLIIENLLRLYGGNLFNSHCKFSISLLANISKISQNKTLNVLNQLEKNQILSIKLKGDNYIKILKKREKELLIDKNNYFYQKKLSQKKLKSTLLFLKNKIRCRSQVLLEYFDEYLSDFCGNCDICITQNKKDNARKLSLNSQNSNEYLTNINKCLEKNISHVEDIISELGTENYEKIIATIKKGIKDKYFNYDNQNMILSLNKKR